MTKRELFIAVIQGHVGTPYEWGGDDPTGLDCSGLINVGAQVTELLGAKEDRTAEGWYQHSSPVTGPALPGDLLLWKNPAGKVTHVEMFFAWVDGKAFSIGAAGGGSMTKTVADAVKAKAFVKYHQPRAGYEVRRIFP